ncbi:MAG: hypothetical protein H0W81_06510 [Chloroflexi bacterium]|nr:hypothetical protein [Chloroflexota bacterium]
MVFAALRFNREDSSAVVKQAVEMVSGMRELNVELQATLDRIRGERDKLRQERDHLADEVGKLSEEVARLGEQVEALREELNRG